MNNLDALDAARGGPFTFRHRSVVLNAPHPADLSYQAVLFALREEVMPETPGDLPYWKVEAIFRAWQMHYDLPDFGPANRLAYVVDHYIDTLTFDLQSHLQLDLGGLWRARRWNTLLAMIDRLPRWSLYYEAVANDPEHATMVAEQLEQEERDPSGVAADPGPALSTWTPEVERLVDILDAVRGLHYIIPASQGATGLQPPAPMPRPTTMLESARRIAQHRRKMKKHTALAARLLPHKYPQGDDSPR